MARAEGDYRRILYERYNNRPVAVPLASKEDYASMLDLLEGRLADSKGHTIAVRPASPTQMSML